MPTIEIDDSVYEELAARVSGFGQTPNDVLREILGIGGPPAQVVRDPSWERFASFLGELEQKRMLLNDDEKYLEILKWLFLRHQQNGFEFIEGYGRGARIYFSREKEKIKRNAPYAAVKRVPETPYYAMATLDNQTKRKILKYALTRLGYPSDLTTRIDRLIPTKTRHL